MTDNQILTAEKIFDILTSQRFANFYGAVEIGDGAPMSRYICSDDGAPTRIEILQKIVELFRLPA